MNSAYITGALSLIFIALNHYALVFEKFKLHKSGGDKSYDPFFNRLLLHVSSILILLLNVNFAYRIILPPLELLPESTLFGSILNFFSFNRSIQSDLVGIFLFTLGFFLRIYAVKTLDSFFTFEVGLRKNHQLVTKAPLCYHKAPRLFRLSFDIFRTLYFLWYTIWNIPFLNYLFNYLYKTNPH